MKEEVEECWGEYRALGDSICEWFVVYVFDERTQPSLPLTKLASQRLSMLGRCVDVIFWMSICLGTVSNALDMSMAAVTVLAGGLRALNP